LWIVENVEVAMVPKKKLRKKPVKRSDSNKAALTIWFQKCSILLYIFQTGNVMRFIFNPKPANYLPYASCSPRSLSFYNQQMNS